MEKPIPVAEYQTWLASLKGRVEEARRRAMLTSQPLVFCFAKTTTGW